MVSVEFLSIRNRCLPRSISAACRRELRDPIEDRTVHRCHIQQKVISQWGKRGKERVVRTISRTMENIPPSKAALLQHVRRAAYQLGYRMCDHMRLSRSPSCLVLHLGWLTSDSEWKPSWTELPEASTACFERVHCGCRKSCRRQCKCRSSNLECTELCKCSEACGDN